LEEQRGWQLDLCDFDFQYLLILIYVDVVYVSFAHRNAFALRDGPNLFCNQYSFMHSSLHQQEKVKKTANLLSSGENKRTNIISGLLIPLVVSSVTVGELGENKEKITRSEIVLYQ
jgi:hypothetical protein